MGDEVRITVIATGFGEPAVKEPAPRPGAIEVRTSDSRPVRAMGRVVDDELDVPTWQRRNQDAPVAAASDRTMPARRGPVGDSVRDEEYDIPTFLRRARSRGQPVAGERRHDRAGGRRTRTSHDVESRARWPVARREPPRVIAPKQIGAMNGLLGEG